MMVSGLVMVAGWKLTAGAALAAGAWNTKAAAIPAGTATTATLLSALRISALRISGDNEDPITRSTRSPRGERQRACPTRRVAPDIRHASGDGGGGPAQHPRITLRRGYEGAQAHHRTARYGKDAAISGPGAA